MTDAAEAAFSSPMPPSRCSRRAPCPRPHVRSTVSPTTGARASTRPLPTALQARVQPGARAGLERERAPQGRGCGGRAGGLPARPPTPSARARQETLELGKPAVTQHNPLL